MKHRALASLGGVKTQHCVVTSSYRHFATRVLRCVLEGSEFEHDSLRSLEFSALDDSGKLEVAWTQEIGMVSYHDKRVTLRSNPATR